MAEKLHPVGAAVAGLCYVLVKVLPVKIASALMAFITRRCARFFVKEKAISRNLSEAFPDMNDAARAALKDEMIENFGRLVAEIAHIRSFQTGAGGATLTARGALTYPFEQKGKAIYVSGHLSNWELLPILFHQRDIPLTIIQTPLHHPGIDSKYMALRRRTGATYVEKSTALRDCIAALKSGESIALLVDQRVDSVVVVDFFGRPTLFTHFPARMALRFNCPIIVAEAIRIGPGRVEAFFHQPIWPGSAPDAERDLTQAMATAVEGSIRRHPEQWFCNKRRWNKRSKALTAERLALEPGQT